MRKASSTLFLAFVVGIFLAAAGPAAAQDQMGGFFRFLFGGNQQKPLPPPGREPQGQPPASGQDKPRVVKPKAPAEPKIVEQPKDANAQVILVLGDSQAAGLAQGLQIAFADTPGVAVANKSRPNSTIVRDDEFDWVAALPGILAEGKFDYVAIMLGVNDRQSFYDKKTGAKTEELRSDRWEALYKERVAKIAKLLKDTGKPVYWVGMPPTERPTHSAFMSYINGLVKPIVEQAGLSYVDIWPGFTDDDGNFAYNGPDVDGQVKRLRAGDGIHFNRAGQRKLAYFVEQSIRDKLQGAPSANLEPMPPEAPQAPQVPDAVVLAAPPPLPPAPWKKVGPVITMGDPGQDGETDLAGGPAPRPAAPQPVAAKPADVKPADLKPSDQMPGGYPITETPLYRRLVRGEGIEAPAGRVDNFVWQRPRPAGGG
jgi:hypothetical protein